MMSRQFKIKSILAVAVIWACAGMVSNWLSTYNNNKMTVESLDSAQACIYDPVHHLVLPVAERVKKSAPLTKFMTGLDAFIIDFSICSLGLYFIITGRTSTFLASVVAFYLTRTIALNIVTFPIPGFYFFENPGFPSYFVDYDRVNDLYFSGHSGCLMIYIIDSIQNKHFKLLYVFVPFFVYTVFILLIEGIHYTNDIIIGVMTAVLLQRVIYLNRLKINLFLFSLLGLVLTPCGRLVEELQRKIVIFQYNGVQKGKHGEGLKGEVDALNVSVSSN